MVFLYLTILGFVSSQFPQVNAIYDQCSGGISTQTCTYLFSTDCCDLYYTSDRCCNKKSCSASGTYGFSICSIYSKSYCCSTGFFADQSCCNSYQYASTNNRDWTDADDSSASLTSIVIGSVVGGFILLCLIIGIPICVVVGVASRRRQNARSFMAPRPVVHSHGYNGPYVVGFPPNPACPAPAMPYYQPMAAPQQMQPMAAPQPMQPMAAPQPVQPMTDSQQAVPMTDSQQAEPMAAPQPMQPIAAPQPVQQYPPDPPPAY